ncbi:pyruvate decarboxylase [Malassezia furfur]|uniref:Pyruvate decarboxylase n=1 Tax=Malassezia furfur TaxID=55194 RepID=A0ABY8EHN2_MALFU|nr:pyruvate decarboxylase [Malassezia furfur]
MVLVSFLQSTVLQARMLSVSHCFIWLGSHQCGNTKKKLPLHHTLADGNYLVYKDAAQNFACAAELLDGTPKDAERIDHVLRTALEMRRPGYLAIPTNVTFTEVPDERLDTPLLPSSPYSEKDRLNEEKLTKDIINVLENAKSPIIVADFGVVQYGHTNALRSLLDRIGLPCFITPLAKSLVDETASYYAGVYIGKNSSKSVLERINAADVVLRLGYFPTDTNTGGFSSNIPSERLIDLNIHDATVLTNAKQEVTQFGHVLSLMQAKIKPRAHAEINKPPTTVPVASNTVISQAYLWSRFAAFLTDGDTVISETGTSSFALPDLPLRKNCQVLAQQLYDSIGWSVGELWERPMGSGIRATLRVTNLVA